jgi:hypothetical protein
MNAIEVQLDRRAELLMKRLNEMGFTKNGKRMVVDQAFELVAAEEGFRNQHALRDKLKNYPALYIPYDLDEEFAKAVMVQHTVDEADMTYAFEAWEHLVAEAAKRLGVEPVTHESERAAQLAWNNVVNRMGWNDQSEILHLESFIQSKGLMGELAKYAETVAKEEDSFGTETDKGPSEAVIGTLEELGYEVVISDLKRPYWSCGDEASTDFETEEQAWGDAWANAEARTRDLASIEPARWTSMDENTRISLVLTHLLQSSVDHLRQLADDAFEQYDFGDSMPVEGMSGWEWTDGDTRATRTVFLADKLSPDADSTRYRFTVAFIDGKVNATSLTK